MKAATFTSKSVGMIFYFAFLKICFLKFKSWFWRIAYYFAASKNAPIELKYTVFEFKRMILCDCSKQFLLPTSKHPWSVNENQFVFVMKHFRHHCCSVLILQQFWLFTGLVQHLSDNWHRSSSTVACLLFLDKLDKVGKTYL